jgi:hypothetical protein
MHRTAGLFAPLRPAWVGTEVIRVTKGECQFDKTESRLTAIQGCFYGDRTGAHPARQDRFRETRLQGHRTSFKELFVVAAASNPLEIAATAHGQTVPQNLETKMGGHRPPGARTHTLIFQRDQARRLHQLSVRFSIRCSDWEQSRSFIL